MFVPSNLSTFCHSYFAFNITTAFFVFFLNGISRIPVSQCHAITFFFKKNFNCFVTSVFYSLCNLFKINKLLHLYNLKHIPLRTPLIYLTANARSSPEQKRIQGIKPSLFHQIPTCELPRFRLIAN